jgi:hypothetical protein
MPYITVRVYGTADRVAITSTRKTRPRRRSTVFDALSEKVAVRAFGSRVGVVSVAVRAIVLVALSASVASSFAYSLIDVIESSVSKPSTRSVRVSESPALRVRKS